jgi:hypothetical protein
MALLAFALFFAITRESLVGSLTFALLTAALTFVALSVISVDKTTGRVMLRWRRR